MRYLWLFILGFLLLGCSNEAPLQVGIISAEVTPSPTPTNTPNPPTATPAPTSTATATPVPTSTQTPLPTQTQTPSPTPTNTATPTPTVTPAPTVDPYLGLSIDELASRSYGGGELEILDTIEEFDTFKRFSFRYPSDGLDIYGFMNVPNEGWDFPVALVLHGYVEPAKWKTVTYTRRYADALAEAGYFVIHPNYRNHEPSDFGDNPFRIGYAIDILNLLAIIDEQSKDITGPLRRADEEKIHVMGHSMGGGIAQRVAVVQPDAFDAMLLYASMNGNERINLEKILEWQGRYTDVEELVPAEALARISPHEYFDRLTVPVAIHHSSGDDIVPIEWSQALCEELTERQHPVDCYFYGDIPHTFYGEADEALMARMIRFFEEH